MSFERLCEPVRVTSRLGLSSIGRFAKTSTEAESEGSKNRLTAMSEDLVLDSAIRDWVLILLSVVMVLIGVLNYFVSKVMKSTQVPDAKIVREGQVVIRARTLRATANFIPLKSFRARKVYCTNEENGLLHVPKGQGTNPQAQMLSDSNMAMDLYMIIPQVRRVFVFLALADPTLINWNMSLDTKSIISFCCVLA